MVQGQPIRGGEGQELLFGEISEIVVFILRSCPKDKGHTKQRQKRRVSFCAKCNHDEIISHILVCVVCLLLLETYPVSVWWSAEMLKGLWEFRDWALQRLLSRVSQCRSTAVFLYLAQVLAVRKSGRLRAL